MNPITSHWLINWLRLHSSQILLVLIMGLAIFLRLYNLTYHVQFTFDQGRDFLVLQDMVGGDLKLVGPTTGIDGFHLGPFFYYLLLPAFYLGGGSPHVVALWLALLVTASLPFFYLLLKRVASERLALWGLFLLVICLGAIQDARLIWNPSLTAPTLIISAWAMVESRFKPKLLVIGLLLYGLCLQTEFAYAIFLAPLYLWWIFRLRSYYSSKLLIVSAAVFLATLAPQLAFEIKHQFIMTRSLLAALTDQTDQTTYWQILRTRPDHIFSVFKQFLYGDKFYAPIFTFFMTWLIFLYSFKRKTLPERFLFGLFALPMAGWLIFKGNHGNFFSYYVAPHYFALILCLIMAIKRLPNRKVTGLIVTISFFIGLYDYLPLVLKTDVYHYTANTQIQALQTAQAKSLTSSTAVELFVPNLRPDQYRYLMIWLNKRFPERLFVEGNQTSQQFFLVYEPATSGASKIAFDSWYERFVSHNTCHYLTQVGITHLEECFKLE